MKNMTRGIVFLLVALAAPVIYGGQPGSGVAEVDVIVKQSPGKRRITDERGNFAFEGLAPGSYTLTFRARKGADLKSPGSTSGKVIVATSYSIKIDGTKRAVDKRLTSDDLLAGYDVAIELGAGARVRGQLLAGPVKNMVWIPKEPGSNLPGRWVEEDSAEAKAAVHRNSHLVGIEAVRQIQR